MKQEFIIAENRVAKAAVVLEANPSLTMRFAAEELSGYLARITGGEFPVAQAEYSPEASGLIILGGPRTAGAHGIILPGGSDRIDSYNFQIQNSNLLLLGNNDRGLLFCVYSFLEHLGVRWFEPGPDGEDLPESPSLKVEPVNVSDVPAFEYRGFTVTACGPVCPQVGLTIGEITEHKIVDFIDWTAKKKQNYISFLSSRIEIESRGWIPVISSEMKKRGLMLGIGGHSWVNAPYGLGDNWHEDPENMQYIAMRDGERKMPVTLNQEMTAHARTQLCVSNEAGVQKVIDNAIGYIKQNPHIDVLAMFAADCMNHWCECEECMKESPSDLYIKFISRLSEVMRRECPEKLLQFAAYIDVLFPPEKRNLSPETDNTTMLFCRLSCAEHTLEDEECTESEPLNFNFPRNKIEIPQGHSNKWFNVVLKGWLKNYNGKICILDYSHWLQLRVARHGDLLFPNPEILQADLRYYKKLGLAGHISVIHPLFSWPNALDMSLLAELNWNPDINLEKTVESYLRGFYRSGGEPVKILSELRYILGSQTAGESTIKTIEDYRDTLKKLRSSAENEKIRERLRRFNLYLDYLLLRKRFNYLKTLEDRKREATICLRELFNFYTANQSAIQPYFEIIDLIVKKNFEFK